jgi:aminoglycoside phosphotransferase (APT) family kinase protein
MKREAMNSRESDPQSVPGQLFPWIEAAAGAQIVASTPASGGNRCRGWALTLRTPQGRTQKLFLRYQPFENEGVEPYSVWREAEVYAALEDTGLAIPRLRFRHPEIKAIVTDFAEGDARYRDLHDVAQRQGIAEEYVQSLARLHRINTAELRLQGFGPADSMHDAVVRELELWEAMYREVDREDPLLEYALLWLRKNLPQLPGPASLVHGDAGPGNFLFSNGRLTALLDWELSHFGDPMEDLAWLSFRAVMEPVPNMPALISAYGEAAGQRADLTRIAFHRVFVSMRIVIIRLRNFSGLPGSSIVSNALNRRLLVEAIMTADGGRLHAPRGRVEAEPTERTALYEQMIEQIRTVVVPSSTNPDAIDAAKDAAKTLKFLRNYDRYGEALNAREHIAIDEALGGRTASLDEGRLQLARAIRAGRADAKTLEALSVMAESAAQLAADSMGRIAGRHLPPLNADVADAHH